MGLVQMVQSYGIELRRAGKELVGLCPFHNDRHPSFNVNPDKEKWHCFGCNAGGDAVTFVMRMENISFKAAQKILNHEVLRPPTPKPEIVWAKATVIRVNAIMREIGQRLRLAEKLEWQEEIELLSRQLEILETLADDLVKPTTVKSLYEAKDCIENLLAIEEVENGEDS
jgi:DNA primase